MFFSLYYLTDWRWLAWYERIRYLYNASIPSPWANSPSSPIQSPKPERTVGDRPFQANGIFQENNFEMPKSPPAAQPFYPIHSHPKLLSPRLQFLSASQIPAKKGKNSNDSGQIRKERKRETPFYRPSQTTHQVAFEKSRNWFPFPPKKRRNAKNTKSNSAARISIKDPGRMQKKT